MLLSFLHQLWNAVRSPPKEHCMPLGNAYWKIRDCRNLSVCGCTFHAVYDASVSQVSQQKLH